MNEKNITNQQEVTNMWLSIYIGLYLSEERHKMGLFSDEEYKALLVSAVKQYAELIDMLC